MECARGPSPSNPINREILFLPRDVGSANRDRDYRCFPLFANALLSETGCAIRAYDLIPGKGGYDALQINVFAVRESFRDGNFVCLLGRGKHTSRHQGSQEPTNTRWLNCERGSSAT